MSKTHLFACSYEVLFQDLACFIRVSDVFKSFCCIAAGLAVENLVASRVLSSGNRKRSESESGSAVGRQLSKEVYVDCMMISGVDSSLVGRDLYIPANGCSFFDVGFNSNQSILTSSMKGATA